MASPVVVKFQVEGVQQVQAAFRTVEQAVVRAENVRVHAAKSSADAEIKEKTRATHAMNQMALRANAIADQLVAKEAAQRAKMAKKAADDTIREAKRADDAQARLLDEFASKQQRIIDKEQREFEKKEKEKTRIAKREADQRAREEESVHRRYARAIGYGIAGGVGNSIRTIGNVATRTLSGFLDVGGGFSLSGAVQKRLELEREARAIAIESYVPNGDPSQKIRRNPNDIVQFARTTGLAYNSDTNDVAKALHTFVEKTSDYEGAKANMPFIAKVAKVTGTSVDQTATLMAQVISQNKDLRGEEGAKAAQRIMLDTINQGRTGSVSYASLAKVSPTITKNAAYFSSAGGISQDQYQDQLMGLAQIGIRTNKSASPTATAISNFIQAAQLGAANIYGKDVRKHTDANGFLTDNVADLTAQMFMTSHGRPDIWKASRKSGGFQLSNFGMTIPLALESVYSKAVQDAEKHGIKGQGAIMAGGNAVRDEVNKSIKSGYGMDTLNEEFKIATDNPAERMDQLIRKLNDSLADKLLPSLERLLPEFEKMVPVFSRLAEQGIPAILDFITTVTKFVDANHGLIDDIIAHPIGAIFAAKVTESLGKALLAEGIRDIFQKALTKAMGGGGGGGGAGGGGAAGLAVVGTLAAVGLEAANNAMDQDINSRNKRAAGTVIGASNIISRLRSGKATPEDLQKAREMTTELRSELGREKEDTKGHWYDIMYGGGGPNTKLARERANAVKNTTEQLDALNKAIGDMVRNMEQHNGVLSESTDPNNPARKGPTKEPLSGGAK